MKKLQRFLERNLIPELPINGTLGIPRATMPQIASDDLEDFFLQLKSKGIRTEKIVLAAHEINPTQNEIDSEKVAGWVLGKKPLVISQDNFILDGHHQWAAALVADTGTELDCIKVDVPIVKLLDYARNYGRVEFRDMHESSFRRLSLLLKD